MTSTIYSNFSSFLKKLLFVLLIFSAGNYSCTTKKNTLVTRTFHNITAKYNGYFNGNESFKTGVTTLESSWQDDYSQLLPMFKYGDATRATSIYPQMDIAIQKATTVIQRHELLVDPGQGKKEKKRKRQKEKKTKKNNADITYKQWIDDSYLLIGKARFYKCEYPQATEVFEYVSRKYKKYPTRYDAMLWLIRTFLESKEYAKAQTLFDLLSDKKVYRKMSGKQQNEFISLETNFQLKQKNYPGAIDPLQKTIASTKNKIVKTRFTFILAQLYEKMGSYELAKKHFTRVLNMSPTYEMTFQAQLERARLSDVNDKNRKELVKELQKMIRDEKNKDYRDQLYLTLATLSQKEGNIPLTLDYLKLAVQNSSGNPIVKGTIYLQIGEIYFNSPDYPLSKSYYDSAVAILPESYPDRYQIISQRNTLKEIVKCLSTITLEDSLLHISNLSEREKEKLVQNIINGINAEEERKKQEQQQQIPLTGGSNTLQNTNIAAGSQWYFYNPTTVSFGYSEFLKKWGNRKLEDNWRRVNKQSLTASETEPDSTAIDEGDTPPPSLSDLKNKNFYLKNIPGTQEQRELSKARIIDAYYTLAIIFKEQLQDLPQAISTFETLLKKYPDNKYQLPSWYQLYRIHLSLGDQQKSDYYKNLILSRNPDSEFARVIQNPEYVKELQSEAGRVNRYYEETYTLFREGQYVPVLARCKESETLFPKNPLKPKFDFLKALSTGKTSNVLDFEKSLNEVITRYPKDPLADQAQLILSYLKSDKSKFDAIKDSIVQLYQFDETANHYYIFVFNRNIDIDKQKILFANYNSVFFGMSGLKIENILLDSGTAILIVKDFPNKEKAMLYFDAIRQSNTVLVQANPNDYKHFVISSKNFPIFYSVKETEQYLAFFQEKYFKK